MIIVCGISIKNIYCLYSSNVSSPFCDIYYTPIREMDMKKNNWLWNSNLFCSITIQIYQIKVLHVLKTYLNELLKKPFCITQMAVKIPKMKWNILIYFRNTSTCLSHLVTLPSRLLLPNFFTDMYSKTTEAVLGKLEAAGPTSWPYSSTSRQKLIFCLFFFARTVAKLHIATSTTFRNVTVFKICTICNQQITTEAHFGHLPFTGQVLVMSLV